MAPRLIEPRGHPRYDPIYRTSGGGRYIQGGLYRLAESLLAVAQELGVEFRPNSEVAEVYR